MKTRGGFYAGALLTVAASILGVSVTVTLVSRRWPEANLRVRSLTLEDGSRNVLATFSSDRGAPELLMFDKQHRKRAAFFLEDASGAPDIYLYDEGGTERAALNLYDSGAPNLYYSRSDGHAPAASMEYTPDGEFHIAFVEYLGDARHDLGMLNLAVVNDKPQPRLIDGAKRTSWQAP